MLSKCIDQKYRACNAQCLPAVDFQRIYALLPLEKK